jgi:hypothetical protein
VLPNLEADLRLLALLALSLILLPTAVGAQELPAVMVLDGIINSGKGREPQTNDAILVLNNDGGLEGEGEVVDDLGGFFVQLSKTQAFNSTELNLRLKQGSVEFALLEGTEPFKFRFAGGFPLTRLRGLSLVIGDVLDVDPLPDDPQPDGGAGATGGTDGTGRGDGTGDQSAGGTAGGDEGTTGGGDPLDVDLDGSFTQQDIDFVKNVVAGRTQGNGRADTNNDNVINTRDIIEMIKTLRSRNRPSSG